MFFLQHGTYKILYDDLGNMETHRNAMPWATWMTSKVFHKHPFGDTVKSTKVCGKRTNVFHQLGSMLFFFPTRHVLKIPKFGVWKIQAAGSDMLVFGSLHLRTTPSWSLENRSAPTVGVASCQGLGCPDILMLCIPMDPSTFLGSVTAGMI